VRVIRLCKDDEYWKLTIDYARSCSWEGVGEHLAKHMEVNGFSDWESVFAAIENNQVLGFCTFSKEDYYPENRYSPWISSIFVDEKARGNKLSGKMIEAAIIYAKEQGFSKVYIPSGMRGFYEKYGFAPIDSLENYGGDFDTIFMKEI
jgi:GNAT superfamily N-acetyltransferase